MFVVSSWPATSWKLGPTDCPETSVSTNRRCVNTLEERKSHLEGGGSLKSRLD